MRFLAVLTLVVTEIGCQVDGPPDDSDIQFDLQFWNASETDLNDVALLSGGVELSAGVLSAGIWAVRTEETALSDDLVLQYSIASTQESPQVVKVDLPPLNEHYDGRAVIIKILGDEKVEILVRDETLVE